MCVVGGGQGVILLGRMRYTVLLNFEEEEKEEEEEEVEVEEVEEDEGKVVATRMKSVKQAKERLPIIVPSGV